MSGELTKTITNGVAEQGQQQKTIPLAKVVKDLKENGALFFVNAKHEPVIYLPRTPFQRYWPAGHDRVVSHVSSVYHDLSNGGYIKPTELAALLALLKEECYTGGRCLTELESPEVERDPIVQAVICFMSTTEVFDDMTATLLEKLRKTEIFRNVRGIEDFPILTNIFSRRLNRLTPALRGLGIEVCVQHKEDGSYCKMTRLKGFMKEVDALTRHASANPSVASPKQGIDFKPTDGSDGNERFDDAPQKQVPAEPKTQNAPTHEVPDNQVAAKGGAV